MEPDNAQTDADRALAKPDAIDAWWYEVLAWFAHVNQMMTNPVLRPIPMPIPNPPKPPGPEIVP
jgi:hypothetical protein